MRYPTPSKKKNKKIKKLIHISGPYIMIDPKERIE